MNTETTIYQLENMLRMKGMANKFRAFIEMPSQSRPSLELALAEMIEAELLQRKNAKTEQLLRAAYSGAMSARYSGDTRPPLLDIAKISIFLSHAVTF